MTMTSARRALLLLFTTVSVCAAGPDPLPTAPHRPATAPPMEPSAGPAAPATVPPRFTGGYGAFLAARFAAAEADASYAAPEFLKALAADPGDPQLMQQAFGVAVMAGRPEAARLAAQLPDNPIAQLLLVDTDVRAGNWASAEQRVRTLPKQGVAQVLQPVLLAWVQQGQGHTDAALATLRPYVDGQRFRGVYALHAAMIADLAGRTADAARLYRVVQTAYEGMNLRLAQILASWDARQG